MTSAAQILSGVRVLVLEDDYFLAMDLQDALEAAGAVVLGPFGNEAEADRALGEAPPHCAFVDINLGQGPSFELPRELLRRNIPFVFVTGYDASIIPGEFDAVERCEKPVSTRRVPVLAARLVAASPPR
jgi:CheY-like chemotaxis protein